jgi:O-antigen/teichoic acid export membrane protein
MSASPRPEIRPATREIDEQTEVGEVYLNALLRSVLRPALAVLSIVLVGLAGLPVFFLLLPDLAGHPVGPVTVAWLLLGVAVFPLLFVAAWWYVRTVERAERDFTEIMHRR